jgi:hypothetical protein
MLSRCAPRLDFDVDLKLEAFPRSGRVYNLDVMSVREIIEELPHLSPDDLEAIEQRIVELAARKTTAAGGLLEGSALCAERLDGRLLLSGARMIRQAEVEAILAEFP